MIQLLNKAVKQLESLADEEQDPIAQLILDELGWKEAFAKSQKQLEALANEALQEFREGKTT